MTDTPFTDKHASPWVPEPNTDWVPAYMVRELEREFNAAKAEVKRLREFIKSKLPPPPYGELEPEWKYAEKLLARLAPAPEEAVSLHPAIKVIKEKMSPEKAEEVRKIRLLIGVDELEKIANTPEPALDWRDLGPDEEIHTGDQVQAKHHDKINGKWQAAWSFEIGVKAGHFKAMRYRTRRPLPVQEMPLEDEIVRLQEVGRLNYAEGQQDLTDCLRYLRDEIEQLKKNQK